MHSYTHIKRNECDDLFNAMTFTQNNIHKIVTSQLPALLENSEEMKGCLWSNANLQS